MAVFDFLKNKQNKKKFPEEVRLSNKKEKQQPEREQPLKAVPLKEEGRIKDISKPEKKAVINRTAYRVLLAPVITEKSSDLAINSQYVFKIAPEATKNEVKKAVETAYKVNILAVNIINIPRKKRRVGKHLGWRQGYKKAVVTVRKGQKIEIAAH